MSDDPSRKTGETTGSVEASAGKGLSPFSMALWGPDGPPEGVLGRDDFVSCPEDDGHDDACWGHVSRIRRPVAIPPPIMLPSQSEMRRIALGYQPVFDDRWLAFMEDDRLFLHRSWTGHGIYEATFAATDTGFVMISACVEGDPARNQPDVDLIEACDLLRDLIVLVSGEPTPLLAQTMMSRIPLLEAVRGDITDQDVDAIVNTANTSLSDGDGVNGAIHCAAGPELLRHCRALGGCEIGRAVATPGFRLEARWIIHTVAPKWTGGARGEPVLVESCYRESLACADEVGAQSVAFPAIATGARGYPLQAAAAIAVDAVRSASTKVRTIRFVCFDPQTLHAYQSAINYSG